MEGSLKEIRNDRIPQDEFASAWRIPTQQRELGVLIAVQAGV